jgi:hypothetical protein
MNYTPEDYAKLYGEQQQPETKETERWDLVIWMICLLIVSGFLGCDGQAAENTARAEQDAYEQYMDVQVAARYRATRAPIKASTLEASITVCQQYTEVNRKWICYAIK